MNPYKLREIYKYLTRAKKADPSLPDVFSASKAPIPAKTQNVQETEAINQFMLRNPRVEKAGGGMLVQPSADGSRPGYAASKGKGIQLTKKEQKLLKENLSTEDFNKLDFDRTGLQSGQINYGVGRNDDRNLLRKVRNILNPGQDSVGVKILNNKNYTDTVIKLTNQGKSPLEITNVLSKKDSKINRNIVSSAINSLIDRKQLNKKYYVMPSSGLIKGDFDKKLKIVEKLVNKGDLGRADIGREAGVADSVVEKWIRANKGDDFYETNFTYEKGVLKKGTLQKQKDLFNLVESKGSISAAEISKLFKINNAQSKTLMADLVSTIYRMSGDSKSNSLVVPYDDPERMKSVLNTIRTAPDFEDIYQRRIETLVREAFPKGSKAQKQAIQSLKDYRKFSFQLKEMAPELGLALDHIVPYQFLDEVAQGSNPINLIRVKPITGAVNRFKSNFDKVRIDLNRALKIDPNNKQLLQKFKLLKELEELTPVEFGGVSKNGTVYNFKQKPIGQSDLIADAKLAIQNYDDVGTFSQQVLGDPNLQSKFIQSGISSKDLGMFKNIEPLNSKKKADILKKMGFKCKFAGSNGGAAKCDDPASYTEDINKTRADLNSNDVTVRAVAKAKLDKGLQIAKTLPTIGKFLRRVGQATVGGVSKALQVSGFGTPVGLAIEGIVEGGIYDYYRKKGYTHDQAYQEGFITPILTGRPEGVPWYGGAESMLEKELTEVREKPTVLEDGTIVPGKIIEGAISDPKILQYQKALEDQEQVFDAFARKEKFKQLEGTDQGTYKKLASDASADIQDLNRSGTISNINRIMNPESMASQAYQTAVERQAGAQDQRARDYMAENYVQTEPSDFEQEKLQRERNEEMLQMFPPPTVETIQDTYKQYGIEDRLKNFMAQDYKDEIKRFDDYQKQSYFADNFRLEKAGGGIAKLAGIDQGPPPVRGPNPQGLPGLLKRGIKI